MYFFFSASESAAVTISSSLGLKIMSKKTIINLSESNYPYPSPKLTLTISSHLGQNDGLREG